MKRLGPALVAIVLVASTSATSIAAASTPTTASTQSAPASGSWTDAVDVPGLATLGATASTVTSVSCSSAGDCSAGGHYSLGGTIRAFVVDQVNGVWGTAVDVPGAGSLGTGDDARVATVTCPADGACAMTGTFSSGLGVRAFVAQRTGGIWGTAIEMPGIAVLDTGGAVNIHATSCSSAGNCSTVGSYYSVAAKLEGFVADLVSGVWQDAIDIPGLVALNTGPNAEVLSVSCPADGSCTASGYYSPGSTRRAFLVDRVGGAWGTPTDVPGLAALDTINYSFGNAVSCSSVGNCSTGGTYAAFDGSHAFVADRVGGTWQTAIMLPGDNGDGIVWAISCPTDGTCSAVTREYLGSGYTVFVADRVGGTWRTATIVPGLAALDTGNDASAQTISCGRAGDCAITGYFTGSGGQTPFVANRIAGTWGTALPVAGLVGRNNGVDSRGLTVACVAQGSCVAGGRWSGSGTTTGFLTDFVVPIEPTPSPPGPDPVRPAFTG